MMDRITHLEKDLEDTQVALQIFQSENIVVGRVALKRMEEQISRQHRELENLRAFKARILEIVEQAENHSDEECPACKRKRGRRTSRVFIG